MSEAPVSREQIEGRIAALERRIRDFNAECLRACLVTCPNRVYPCIGCYQNERIARVVDGKVFLWDGREVTL